MGTERKFRLRRTNRHTVNPCTVSAAPQPVVQPRPRPLRSERRRPPPAYARGRNRSLTEEGATATAHPSGTPKIVPGRASGYRPLPREGLTAEVNAPPSAGPAVETYTDRAHASHPQAAPGVLQGKKAAGQQLPPLNRPPACRAAVYRPDPGRPFSQDVCCCRDEGFGCRFRDSSTNGSQTFSRMLNAGCRPLDSTETQV